MFANNHLIQLILAFLPIILYAYPLHWVNRRSSSVVASISYLIGGCIAILFSYIVAAHVFPLFQDLMATMMFLSDRFTGMTDDSRKVWSLVFYCFIQVALLEESMKALAFRTISFIREDIPSSITLTATLLYSCMVAIGFACIENLQYFTHIGGYEVVVRRTFTATIAHIVAGAIMGYFFALSRLRPSSLDRFALIVLGVVCATIFHGSYNFLITATDGWMWTLHMNKTIVQVNLFYFLLLAGVMLAWLLMDRIRIHSSEHVLGQRKNNP